jgi:hypothetical protein
MFCNRGREKVLINFVIHNVNLGGREAGMQMCEKSELPKSGVKDHYPD